MVTRLNSIPPVVAIEDYWGGIVASGAVFDSHLVLGITAQQDIVGEWTSETYYDDVILDTIKFADVQSLGVNLFDVTQGSGSAILGSGNLEHYKIAGVSATAAPVNTVYNQWGFVGTIQNVTWYASTYGGVDHFGDARRVALRNKGLLWIKYSGAAVDAPSVGLYAEPSDGADGFAQISPSGSAAININYGKIFGYASGSNIGGLTAGGAGVAAQYVMVDFARGTW